ncbi:hypothetical protein ElyMa_005149900 [Elysia marginata]|uniref:Uncharacterized protein n=1 Tax=Elysia marginata TaxID=1093978 RepID=A0AAV4JN49_9GAST|nr:hypothetical protein ElyMa_005149900 [Elysia marginata]
MSADATCSGVCKGGNLSLSGSDPFSCQVGQIFFSFNGYLVPANCSESGPASTSRTRTSLASPGWSRMEHFWACRLADRSPFVKSRRERLLNLVEGKP